MNITITPITSWQRVVNAARLTNHKEPIDHEPKAEWIYNALISQHSPIRLREYDILFEDVPHFVMTHLVRHFMGVEKFVGTSRPDRLEEEIPRHEQRKDDPCTFQLSINAQALITLSSVRLCGKAEMTTRFVWRLVKSEMEKVDPIMASVMVPQCVRCGGHCPEMQSCGANKSKNMKTITKLYWHEK